jgi:hypothetical protein
VITVFKATVTAAAISLAFAGSSSAQPGIEQARDAARVAQQLAREQREDELRRLAASIRPLQVQVVISKYKDEKKVASAPYTLSVNANDGSGARLRMGAQIPVPMMQLPSVDGKPLTGIPAAGPVQYKDIGTNIDCVATGPLADRYKLELVIEESSVAPIDAGVPNAPPAIRSFRLANTAMLRDGESTQFSTALDKITGEITKIDVSLTVVK